MLNLTARERARSLKFVRATPRQRTGEFISRRFAECIARRRLSGPTSMGCYTLKPQARNAHPTSAKRPRFDLRPFSRMDGARLLGQAPAALA